RHDHPGDADGSAEIDEMDMGMRGHDRPGKDQEIRRHCIEIAHRAVGDDASAAEPFMDIALHFTPECAEALVGGIDVLDYRDARPRRGGDVLVVGEPHSGGFLPAARMRLARTDYGRPGEGDDRL